MSDHVSVLFANDVFYAAFASRDLAAMDHLWSQRATVTCLHPGWAPLVDRYAVMQSWRAILSDPKAPSIDCLDASAHLLGNVAYVICYERLKQGFLAATNVFVREDDGWKIIHHQAGAVPAPAIDPEAVRQPIQ